MRILDRSRPYAESFCMGGPTTYHQDGIKFNSQGEEIIEEAKEIVNPVQEETTLDLEPKKRGRPKK